MAVFVSSLLAHKGGDLVTIEPSATVFEAIRRMVDANVGAVVVLDGDTADSGGGLAGIFTERDYLRRIALEGRTSRETRVADVMTTGLVTVGPGESVETCLALMTEHRIRHLPVVDGERLAGVVSIGDCVRAQAEDARGEAESLQRFVAGDYGR